MSSLTTEEIEMPERIRLVYVGGLSLLSNHIKNLQSNGALILLFGTVVYLLHMFGLVSAHESVEKIFTIAAVVLILAFAGFLLQQSWSSTTMHAVAVPPETGQPRQAPPVTETVDPPQETVDRASVNERSEPNPAPQTQPHKGAPGDSSRHSSGRNGSQQRTDGDGSDRSRPQKGSGGTPPSTSSEAPTAEAGKPPPSAEERARLEKMTETA